MRFTWAVLSRAVADPDLELAVLAVAVRGPDRVEDAPVKAMATAAAAPKAVLVAMD
jgi:hypothetical protein